MDNLGSLDGGVNFGHNLRMKHTGQQALAWEFFKNNPTDSLSVMDAMVKFELSREQASRTLSRLKYMGLIERNGHCYSYRSKR